ncbi:hypothetical protein K492DRAFT_236220 [Lichtheimia hyalospora FSU 10163]|nr:hypothetical protein K492DRAFT_236220 [Lichtheimia hyalospora FSU 10163]
MTIHAAEKSNTIDPEDESNPRLISAPSCNDESVVALNTPVTNADHDMANQQSDSDDVILVGSSDRRHSYLDIDDLDTVSRGLSNDDSNHVPTHERDIPSVPQSSSDTSASARKRKRHGRTKKKDFGPPAAMTANMEPMYAVERIVNHKIYRGKVVQYEVQWAGFSSEHNSIEEASVFHEDCPEFCAEYWDQHEPRPPNAPCSRSREGTHTSISRSVTHDEQQSISTSSRARSVTFEEQRSLRTLSPCPSYPTTEMFELDDAEGEVDSTYHKGYNDDSPKCKDIQPLLSPSLPLSPFKISNDYTTSDQIPQSPLKQQMNERMDSISAPRSPLPSPPPHNHIAFKDKKSPSLDRAPLGKKSSMTQPCRSNKGNARIESTPKLSDELSKANATLPNLLDNIIYIPKYLKRQGFILSKDGDYPTHDTKWDKEIDKIQHIQCIGTKNQLLAYVSWKNGCKTVHPVQDLHHHCPDLLIDFYEEHLQLDFVDNNNEPNT